MDDSIATTWHQHTRQHVDCCGFSGSIVAEKCNDFVLFDAHGQLIDCFEIAKLHGHPS